MSFRLSATVSLGMGHFEAFVFKFNCILKLDFILKNIAFLETY